jgi:AraC-like DNA-binding protein
MSDLATAETAANGGYSVVCFSTSDYAPHRRLDALREAYGRTLQKVEIEPLSVERLHAKATLRRMPGLAMITCQRSAAIYRRRREVIDHDDVGITVGLTSGYEAQQLGRTLSLSRGDAVVMTGGEPALLRVPKSGEYISIRLPVRAVAPFVADLDAAYGRLIPDDNRALRLLVRYIALLQETDSFAAADLRRQAVAHIHDLVALAIGATRDAAEAAKNRGAQAARLCEIKEDIANRLGEADLSLATIAARHRLMPRYVQRLFESEGVTFTAYVLAQRLALAHRVLTNPRYADLKISAVAFNTGFGDLSYFNRTFRRRYGVAPSEIAAPDRQIRRCSAPIGLAVGDLGIGALGGL